MMYVIFTPGYAPFLAKHFEPENHFITGMMVFDIKSGLSTQDGTKWHRPGKATLEELLKDCDCVVDLSTLKFTNDNGHSWHEMETDNF